MITKDYSLFKSKNINFDLSGVIVIDNFVASNNFEGGLTIIFEKNNKRGIIIFGYTELGEWIEYLQYGSNVKIDETFYDEQKNFVKDIIVEYKIK